MPEFVESPEISEARRGGAQPDDPPTLKFNDMLLTSTAQQAPPTPTILHGLLTLDEVAQEANCSLRTVQRWIERGLPVIKIGNLQRIRPESAREWFVSQERKPPPPTRRRSQNRRRGVA